MCVSVYRSIRVCALITSMEVTGLLTSEDRARVLGLLHRYMDLVLRGAVEDPLLADAYIGVPGMVAPLMALA
ncbi:MAG: hypothetical protein NVS2B12_42220 [Ktedonobacteraceae bacterium]